AALHTNDAVPLPIADQFIHPAAGSTPESLSVPKRQLIEEVAGVLVRDTVRCNSFVEPQSVPAQDSPRLILMRAGEEAGIDVQHFRKGVTGFKGQSSASALSERDRPSVIAAVTQIHPGLSGADKAVRTRVRTTRPPREVLRSLPNAAWDSALVLWTGVSGQEGSTSETSRGICTPNRWNGIHIDGGRKVIGLAAHITQFQRELLRDPPLHLQAPFLSRGGVQGRIDTTGSEDRTVWRLQRRLGTATGLARRVAGERAVSQNSQKRCVRNHQPHVE